MPDRFDHAVIAVRNLPEALQQFQRLGFDAQSGGRHAEGGTHNGLIRFGLDYLELLAVYDEDTARANKRGKAILDSIENPDTALIGFALATTTIEEDSARFVSTGTRPSIPQTMGRQRPDGRFLTWRVSSPEEVLWKSPWPFLIQWDMPDDIRLTMDVPGKHPNGATGWKRVAVAVHDLETAMKIYQNQLGLELIKQDTCPVRVASRVTFALGESIIEVLSPRGPGLIQQILAQKGQGPYALYFTSANLPATQAFFETHHIAFVLEGVSGQRIALEPSEISGMFLYFTA